MCGAASPQETRRRLLAQWIKCDMLRKSVSHRSHAYRLITGTIVCHFYLESHINIADIYCADTSIRDVFCARALV